jgi:hypothetical protein
MTKEKPDLRRWAAEFSGRLNRREFFSGRRDGRGKREKRSKQRCGNKREKRSKLAKSGKRGGDSKPSGVPLGTSEAALLETHDFIRTKFCALAKNVNRILTKTKIKLNGSHFFT